MSSISEKERLNGWLRLNSLWEQVSQGQIGKAYLWKEKLMRDVQDTVLELAPQGVNSQGEFAEIVSKAIQAVDTEQRASASHEAQMADVELTLGMIERTLKMIPFQVFFASSK